MPRTKSIDPGLKKPEKAASFARSRSPSPIKPLPTRQQRVVPDPPHVTNRALGYVANVVPIAESTAKWIFAPARPHVSAPVAARGIAMATRRSGFAACWSARGEPTGAKPGAYHVEALFIMRRKRSGRAAWITSPDVQRSAPTQTCCLFAARTLRWVVSPLVGLIPAQQALLARAIVSSTRNESEIFFRV